MAAGRDATVGDPGLPLGRADEPGGAGDRSGNMPGSPHGAARRDRGQPRERDVLPRRPCRRWRKTYLGDQRFADTHARGTRGRRGQRGEGVRGLSRPGSSGRFRSTRPPIASRSARRRTSGALRNVLRDNRVRPPTCSSTARGRSRSTRSGSPRSPSASARERGISAAVRESPGTLVEHPARDGGSVRGVARQRRRAVRAGTGRPEPARWRTGASRGCSTFPRTTSSRSCRRRPCCAARSTPRTIRRRRSSATGVGRFYLTPTGNDPAALRAEQPGVRRRHGGARGFPGTRLALQVHDAARGGDLERPLAHAGRGRGFVVDVGDSMATEGWALYARS